MKLLKILVESIKEQHGVGLWGKPSGVSGGSVGRDFTNKGEPLYNVNPEDFKNTQSTETVGTGGKAEVLDPNTNTINPSSKKNSSFGMRNGEPHNGNDYSVAVGTNIVHFKKGSVLRAGNIDPDGWGNVIEIKNEDGSIVRYCHLSKINVSKGDEIEPNTVVGQTGGAKGDPGAGNSTGPHLHFEYLVGNKEVDPSNGSKDDETFGLMK